MFVRQWGLITPNELLAPSLWVKRFIHLITKGGRVLDLACGEGRHSVLLAKEGYSVLSVDRDLEPLKLQINRLSVETASKIELSELDLEAQTWPFGDKPIFDGVVVTNYLYRPYIGRILPLLTPGGVLIYETFALGNEQFGRPSNPNFLLKPNELLDLIGRNPEFETVSFEQGLVKSPKPASIQRICAVKSCGIPLQLRDER